MGEQAVKCEICGREYVALGVHIRHKHKIDPDEYRDEFGLMRTAPLVDAHLSDALRAGMNARLRDDAYRSELTERCLDNAKNNVGKRGPGMSDAGKIALANRSKARNDAYLIGRSKEIADALQSGKTMMDVRRITGSGPVAAKKMAKIAGVEYSKELAKRTRDERAAATTRAKALARVALVIPYLSTTKSAAEMCRLAGISIRTYKNWLKAGLIQRHQNGRGRGATSAAQCPQQTD